MLLDRLLNQIRQNQWANERKRLAKQRQEKETSRAIYKLNSQSPPRAHSDEMFRQGKEKFDSEMGRGGRFKEPMRERGSYWKAAKENCRVTPYIVQVYDAYGDPSR